MKQSERQSVYGRFLMLRFPHPISLSCVISPHTRFQCRLYTVPFPHAKLDFHHLQAKLQSSPSSDPMILVVHFHHANQYTFRSHDLFTIVVCDSVHLSLTITTLRVCSFLLFRFASCQSLSTSRTYGLHPSATLQLASFKGILSPSSPKT